ncbi:MAG: DNA repair protein RadA [Clostridia bacterium]|nr:DNA repair protein RadA [Clostridia bacterium]
MAKSTSQFICNECGATSPKWLGRCPSCGKFNTMIEETIAPAKSGIGLRASSNKKPVPLSEVEREKFERKRSGLDELDAVLGGGIVPGSLVLIGGDPGIGKSTLLTQVASNLAQTEKVLYVCAEESCSQVKLRCDRLGLNAAHFYLLNETCLEDVEPSLAGARYVIIDSVQAVYTDALSSAAGSVGQIRECAAKLMRIAKAQGITFFIVGHVTKEGALAGPKVLEHVMDTVLYFEGEREDNFRLLRSVKNRFGSVQEIGVFEMTEKGLVGVKDYAGLFLSDKRGEAAGCVVTPSETGNKIVMVELQTLIAKTAFGLPRRMPLGIDMNKLIVLTAVLEKRCGIPLFNQDVYINAMGGIKLTEPSIDLAVCLALASAFKGIPIDAQTAVFGETGLTGEIRGVSNADRRVNECIKMGFKRVVIPYKNKPSCEKYKGQIEIVAVSSLWQAIKAVLPE